MKRPPRTVNGHNMNNAHACPQCRDDVRRDAMTADAPKPIGDLWAAAKRRHAEAWASVGVKL